MQWLYNWKLVPVIYKTMYNFLPVISVMKNRKCMCKTNSMAWIWFNSKRCQSSSTTVLWQLSRWIKTMYPSFVLKETCKAVAGKIKFKYLANTIDVKEFPDYNALLLNNTTHCIIMITPIITNRRNNSKFFVCYDLPFSQHLHSRLQLVLVTIFCCNASIRICDTSNWEPTAT